MQPGEPRTEVPALHLGDDLAEIEVHRVLRPLVGEGADVLEREAGGRGQLPHLGRQQEVGEPGAAVGHRVLRSIPSRRISSRRGTPGRKGQLLRGRQLLVPFARAARRDRADEQHALHPLRVLQGVERGDRRVVRGAEQGHPLEAEVAPHRLEVRGVVLQAEVARVRDGARPAPAAGIVEDQAPPLGQRQQGLRQPVGVGDDHRLRPVPQDVVVEVQAPPDEYEPFAAPHRADRIGSSARGLHDVGAARCGRPAVPRMALTSSCLFILLRPGILRSLALLRSSPAVRASSPRLGLPVPCVVLLGCAPPGAGSC